MQSAKTLSKELDAEFRALQDGVKAEWMENWYDGLGYCKPSRPDWSNEYADLTPNKAHGMPWART